MPDALLHAALFAVVIAQCVCRAEVIEVIDDFGDEIRKPPISVRFTLSFGLKIVAIMSSTPWTKRRKVLERMQALRSRKRQEEESDFYEELSAAQEESPEERESIIEERYDEGGTATSTLEGDDLDYLQPSPETDDSGDESSDNEANDDDFGFDFEEASEIYSEWIQEMDRDDKMMLSVFLADLLVNKLHLKVKDASELVGSLVCKNEKTVRTWRRQFYHNVGSFPLSSQGMYNRYSVLNEEDVKEKALAWLRKGAYDKSSVSKLTVHSFLAFVNTELLPSCDLPENAPTRISLRCAYRWMHKMGFRYLRYKKGTFVDGHDREDVVEYRGMCLRKLNVLESTHQPPPYLRTTCSTHSPLAIPVLDGSLHSSSMMRVSSMQMRTMSIVGQRMAA